MKKLKFLFLIMLTTFMSVSFVNAEQIISLSPYYKDIYENATIDSLTYDDVGTYLCDSYSSCYEKALELFNHSDNQYYYIRLDFSNLNSSGTSWIAYMYLYTFDFSPTDIYTTTLQLSPSRYYFTINNKKYSVNEQSSGTGGIKNSFYELYDTNFSFKSSSDVTFSNFYSGNSNLTINSGEYLPKIKDLVKYDSYEDYKSVFDNYTEVNLDDYEYVILNLKDYSKKEAFETNLQVKGSIGITPVYEFGTTEKQYITDLCNIDYLDFTNYRFFILKNDLLNNAVYIVKDCNNSGSSFIFDSSIFDITYVTTENVNDPVVTFGGVEYHTIPFNKLSNSVNKNEEDGFIPGATEQFDPFGSVVEYVSSFWNSLTTFMGLVTKFFNTLPIEIRAISITMFTTAITLGVIKFIKS